MKWYTFAAEQGFAHAQNNLGLMYANGLGVPQDDKTALKWYILAAGQGDADAQTNLGLMYRKIAEAQKLARECMKKNYKGC